MNKEKTIRFMWYSMWITLLLMVVLKLCFNFYYPIVIENSKLLEISYYIDKHKWLDESINFIFYSCNGLLLSLCVLHEKWFKKKWHFIIMFSSSSLVFLAKLYNFTLGSVLIIIPYLIIPLLITEKPKRWIFITFLLDNLFQILSNFARGNSLIICDTALVRKLMWIDYYLLFIIYYLGGMFMGMESWLPWFTKKETVINAKIEKLQKKIKKLEDKKQCLKKR